jgi:hypothetical protein
MFAFVREDTVANPPAPDALLANAPARDRTPLPRTQNHRMTVEA